jgi:hypothetical protein
MKINHVENIRILRDKKNRLLEYYHSNYYTTETISIQTKATFYSRFCGTIALLYRRRNIFQTSLIRIGHNHFKITINPLDKPINAVIE